MDAGEDSMKIPPKGMLRIGGNFKRPARHGMKGMPLRKLS